MASRLDAGSTIANRLAAKSIMASRLDAASMTPSMAPLTAKSVLRNASDFKFASRQSVYPLLAPKERKEQDKWAQEMIEIIAQCPELNDWTRRENPGGYQCKGEGHGMTDELLAEGLGGILALKMKKWGEFTGPYYPNAVTGKYERDASV